MPEFRMLQPHSLLDWDGKICAVAYVPRCNLRCPFCQNGRLLESPEQFPLVGEERMRALFEEHGDFLDGLCITGGEPTTYDDLPDFIARIKPACKSVKLDTNGTNPAMLREILSKKLVDYVAMDIKAPLDDRYGKAVGGDVSLDALRESIEAVMKDAPDHEFRTTIVPTTISKAEISDIAESIKGARKWALQQYVPGNALSPAMREVRPYEGWELNEMADVARKYVKKVVVRGPI